jgi:hypothetical protein
MTPRFADPHRSLPSLERLSSANKLREAGGLEQRAARIAGKAGLR